MGGAIRKEVDEDVGQGAHLGWGVVGQKGHHQGPQRARAADPLGGLDGELVPPCLAAWRPRLMGCRPLGRPNRRRRREHGWVHGGLLCS